MAITEDSWLSERFGHPVYSVSRDDRELVTHAAGQSAASYQAKVPAGDVELLRALEDAGMRVVSLTLVLSRLPAGEVAPSPANVVVRQGTADDRDAVAAIAERGFEATRFHLDPDVPRDTARGIAVEWARNYAIGQRGEQLLVAERDGELVGFLGVNALDEDGLRLRDIDLVAVAPELRSAGVGTALVERFLVESDGRCDRVRVGTQASNERAIALYERLGFITESAHFDLHMHVGA
ncbi:MAG: hypothetical protein QOJ29_2892 [Thermoleophilaceae bacterium]|jgi:ribosomal protein S18 acetylase RimI-like enzyme|nr:hypothetical protein [Thermoleophilaceae bacterium]